MKIFVVILTWLSIAFVSRNEEQIKREFNKSYWFRYVKQHYSGVLILILQRICSARFIYPTNPYGHWYPMKLKQLFITVHIFCQNSIWQIYFHLHDFVVVWVNLFHRKQRIYSQNVKCFVFLFFTNWPFSLQSTCRNQAVQNQY